MSEGTLDQVLVGEAAWCVLHGDCLGLLKSVPDNSFDACATDAPYHLTSASRGGSPRTNDPAKPHGRHAIGSKGFMGKTWDGGDVAMRPETWAEIMRVLKPGAHLVAFGGTRTAHRMACAIEDGGFEIRDTLEWLYGSGFPKSLNVSKAIDNKLGIEPTVVGHRVLTGTAALSTEQKGGTFSAGIASVGATKEILVTEPTTDEAKEWDGWGTALKPAHEPIILARKPIEKGLTVAENVLKWGTGALNIDACRVRASGNDRADSERKKDERPRSDYEMGDGRWPPNVVFTHDARCRRLGAVAVPANPTWDTPNRETEPSAFTGADVSPVRHANGRNDEVSADRRYADNGSTSFAPLPGARREDTETVDQYECVDGCPVRELAMQSGQLTSGSLTGQMGGGTGKESSSGIYGTRANVPMYNVGDSGSAARYFPQFEWTELDDITPFLYAAKAGRAERDAGLDQFRSRSAAELTDSEDGQARLESPRTGAGRTGGAKNPHPTIKPWKELLCWLVRLITPPRGVVLDPFAGAASCGIACLTEGYRYAGIELLDTDEEPHVSIARARLHHVEGREFVPRESLRASKPPAQRSLFSTAEVCEPVRARTLPEVGT